MNRPQLFAADKTPNRRQKCLAAFTLAELLLGLTIVAILSVAVSTLLAGAYNTNNYLTSAGDTNSQVNLAVARMLHNLRTCSSLDDPTGNTAQSTFTIESQPDASNGLQTYTVVYALTGSQLIETDSRYGANVICSNVTAFSVQLLSGTTNVVQITLTAGSVTRTFRTYCRNL